MCSACVGRFSESAIRHDGRLRYPETLIVAMAADDVIAHDFPSPCHYLIWHRENRQPEPCDRWACRQCRRSLPPGAANRLFFAADGGGEPGQGSTQPVIGNLGKRSGQPGDGFRVGCGGLRVRALACQRRLPQA